VSIFALLAGCKIICGELLVTFKPESARIGGNVPVNTAISFVRPVPIVGGSKDDDACCVIFEPSLFTTKISFGTNEETSTSCKDLNVCFNPVKVGSSDILYIIC
jgi:hypothetical protein